MDPVPELLFGPSLATLAAVSLCAFPFSAHEGLIAELADYQMRAELGEYSFREDAFEDWADPLFDLCRRGGRAVNPNRLRHKVHLRPGLA